MEVMLCRVPCKTLVHDRHEQLCKWGGDRNAAIVVHVSGIPLALI